MSRRDDVWRAFLGRDPNPAEQTDKLVLAEHLVLGENDPFWGVVAFLYSRLPGMAAEHERLRITKELVDKVSGRLDALPDMLQSSVHAAVADGLPGIRELNVRLGKSIEQGLAAVPVSPMACPTVKDWVMGCFKSVLSAISTLAIIGVLLVVAYGVGTWEAERAYAVQQAMTAVEAPSIESWARTREGHEVYVWARLNDAGLKPVLQCNYGESSKIIHRDGMTICYPSGSGKGYYLVGK
ncbi:MAG: hypothetical protein ACLPXB_08350 [Thiobacillaceae bacterium]